MSSSAAAAQAFATVRPGPVAVAASWRRKAAQYRRNGYMVAPQLLDRDRIAALRAEITAIGRGERGGEGKGDIPNFSRDRLDRR